MQARRTWLSFAAILAVLVGVFAASPGLAASSGSWADRHQFPNLPEFSTDEFTPAVMPIGANPNRLTTVMLKMAGDSVAEANFKAGRSFGESDKAQVRGDLQGHQDAIKGAIAANGATVLGQYQDAYNGIKVRASAGSLKSLASLPNVVAVRAVQTHELDNAVSVPFIGTPQAWSGLAGVHGEGIKVAIIDTGIDYTHADFGGPGTVAAWNNAVSKSTLDPTLLSVCQTAAHTPCFGPNAPRVKGGVDLVGDSYNADPNSSSYQPVPHPDPNPLDCFGHGSHVAGTAAGSGVLADGTTYGGPYNATTISSHNWNVGPGVAPKADLYAIRVFGCAGSTDVVVDALNWAVAHNMDVVNMSLGSSYGAPNDPDNEATNNAKQAGVIVVASAGNSGNSPYITGSPSIAEGAIGVAASDSTPLFPGAKLTLHPSGTTIDALNANGFNITSLSGLQTVILPVANGFSGCDESQYSNVTGKLVITVRGSCARVDRATFGARHGAAAVAMINNAPDYPPFEGPIPNVNIPFLGIRQQDGTALNGATTVDVEAKMINNPGFKKYASFTSAGPRRGDSMLKPDVTAPGVSIQSTGMGSGTGGVRMSGTSMAAPHVTGVAALAKQAHPGWDVGEVRAAIVNTATISPSTVAGYQVNLGGGGLVQPAAAVATSATATADNEATSLSFGYNELTSNYSGSLQFQVTNHSRTALTFNTSVVQDGGRVHTLTVSAPSITLGPGDSQNLTARLAVAASAVGSADLFRQVSGAVVLTPAGGGNHGVALRVPYQMIPRARSNVATSIPASFSPRSPNATATITNVGGTRTGTADFYAWGLSGHDTGLGELGLRAVGVQSFPGTLVFAINTYGRFETPNVNEYDILIDTTGTGHPNYLLAAIDNGLLTTGSFDGSYVAFLCKLSNCGSSGRIVASVYAPFNGSTLEIPVPISRLGLTSASPRFTYSAASGDVRGDRGFVGDEITNQAPFNAFNSAISTGQFDIVPVGATVTDTVSINSTEWAHTPALGLMIVVADNRSGGAQAQLVRVR